MGLSPLQQELYDELEDTLENDLGYIDEVEAQKLADDISTMNAAELRHNLRVFRDCK